MSTDWSDLRAALVIVTRTLRLPATALPGTRPAGPDPVVTAIAAAGGRAVRLPLAEALASRFRGPVLTVDHDGAAVVLLPGRRGGWTTVSWSDGRELRRPAEPTDELLLAREGWVFRRDLPHRGVTGPGLLRFGGRGHGAALAVAIGAGVIASAVAFAVPVGSLLLLAGVLADRADLVRWSVLATVGGIVLGWAAGLVRDRAVTAVRSHAQLEVEPALWSRLLALPLSFTREHPVRRVVGYLSGVSTLRSLLGATGLQAVLGGLFSGLAVALLMVVDLGLGVVALAVVLTVLLAVTGLAVVQQRHDRAVFAGLDDVQATLYPALLGIDEVHALGAEAEVRSRWARAFHAQKRADAAGLRCEEISAALTSGMQSVLVAVLVPLAWSWGLGLAGVWAVILVAGQLHVAMTRVQDVVQAVASVGPVHARMRPVLAARPERTPGAGLPARLGGTLRLADVHFGYPGSAPLLTGVDLAVAPGEFVALVGPSGSGKSTIIRLLLGLSDPDAGRVLVDGTDLTHLAVDAVRAQIGYVAQDARTLRGDLRAVLTGGSPDATDDDLARAVAAAGLTDDLAALPMGLDTRLSDGDAALSGGQVQRLLLARALVKGPSVLLLDEATSALDDEVQDAVSDAVAALAVTRVVVAHRHSTIRRADRVLALRDGRLHALTPQEIDALPHDPASVATP